MNEDILLEYESQFEEEVRETAEDLVETAKYLVFATDDLKMGVHTDNVVEIITNYAITYLPMVPHFIRGIINLRGQMLPIVDVRLRLGKEPIEGGLVIVLIINEVQLGILVDAVDQMVDIPLDAVLPMPARSSQKLVNGMSTLPDGSGTMLVLDCEQLLDHE